MSDDTKCMETKDPDEVVDLINSLIRGDCPGKKTGRGVMWSTLANQIRRMLYDPNATEKGRVAIICNMMKHKLTESQVCAIVKTCCRWNDYSEAFTRNKVNVCYRLYAGNENHEARREDVNNQTLSHPTPATDNEPVNIDVLIGTVTWRAPDIKPTLASLRHFFLNRTDVFATQHAPDGKHTDWYYLTQYHEITDQDIINHLETWINPQCTGPVTLGAYENDGDGTGKWLCADLDDKNNGRKGEISNLTRAYLICGFFEYRGISCLLENASEGFESYHVWVFCDPTDIRTLREIGKYAAQQCGVVCEIFPKARYNSRLGDLVRIPFSLNRKRTARSRIITYDRTEVVTLYTYLCSLQECPA